MNKLNNKFLFISTVITLLTSANTTGAVEIFLRDPDHRGVIEFTPFQIYPENRVGNGIYLEKKLLDSHPQRVILNIVNIKDTDNHVYLFRSAPSKICWSAGASRDDGVLVPAQLPPGGRAPFESKHRFL